MTPRCPGDPGHDTQKTPTCCPRATQQRPPRESINPINPVDPVITAIVRFFALLDWSHVPEHDPRTALEPGPRPHHRARLHQSAAGQGVRGGQRYITQLRAYLVEHPALVLELGFPPSPGCHAAQGGGRCRAPRARRALAASPAADARPGGCCSALAGRHGGRLGERGTRPGHDGRGGCQTHLCLGVREQSQGAHAPALRSRPSTTRQCKSAG